MRTVNGSSEPTPPPPHADVSRGPGRPVGAGGSSGRPSGNHQHAPILDVEDSAARIAFDRARHGDRTAYGTVVRLYQDRLYNAVFRLVGDHDDAAEITQEAFTRGLEKMTDFRGDSGPYTWLFRIAMNAAVSRIRRGGRRKTISLDAMMAAEAGRPGGGGIHDRLPGRESSPDEAAELSEDHRAVTTALWRLDAEYRALLVMRDLEGFDYRQMAEVMGLPLGTLKSRLFRARVALRDLLQEHFNRRQ